MGIMKLIWGTLTLWTAAVLATGDKTLLWIVGDVRCQDWKYSSDDTISSSHLNTVTPSVAQRLENDAHRLME